MRSASSSSPPWPISPGAARPPITEIVLRSLTEADAQAYREFRLFMLGESPSAFSSDLETSREHPLSFFRERARNDPENFIVAALDGERLIGTAGGVRESEAKRRHLATVVGMYMHPDYRGRGLGMRLLTTVIDRLSQLNGIEHVRLSVNAGNEPALALYARAGFEVYGREPAALKVAGADHDELLMSLTLR